MLARFRRNGRCDGEAAVDAIFEFTTRVLKVVAEHTPIVKFQSAYFEQFMSEGVEAYYSLVQEAEELGLLVIGDVKRGDIGSTVDGVRDRPSGRADGRRTCTRSSRRMRSR